MRPRPYLLVTGLVECAVDRAVAVWTPRGTELGGNGTARPDEVPGTLLIEALVQCGGLLLHRVDAAADTHWLLGALPEAQTERLAWGRAVTLTCEVEHRSLRAATLTAAATVDSAVVARARMLLVRL